MVDQHYTAVLIILICCTLDTDLPTARSSSSQLVQELRFLRVSSTVCLNPQVDNFNKLPLPHLRISLKLTAAQFLVVRTSASRYKHANSWTQ